MKIAMIEVSHWHAPIYVRGLRRLNADVVAVSDRNKEIARKTAEELDCRCYTDYTLLTQKENPDFVFAFGRHREMPRIAEYLIKKNLPFAMEKPMGTSSQDIEKILELERKYGNFIAIPFVFRYSPILQRIECLRSNHNLGSITHLYFRFIAGPPFRYVRSNCSWMLDREQSGGGCSINLAVHFIDLFLYLTQGETVKTVYAALNNLAYETGIEDFSTIVLQTNRDVVCTIETGYAYPSTPCKARDICYYLTTTNGYVSVREKEFIWSARDGTQKKETVVTDTDDYYPMFIQRILEEFKHNKRPRASVEEMFHVMKIIDAAYTSNSLRKTIEFLRDDFATCKRE